MIINIKNIYLGVVMRKRVKVLVSLSLVCILTGCSTKKNDVSITPTSASSPTAVPVAEQSELLKEEQPSPASLLERAIAGEFVEKKNGDSFDLDGDGKVEQIKCDRANKDEDCVNYVLSIGDATYSLILDNSTDNLYVSKMTPGGENLQVLIDDYGPSDDCNTNIFCYEDGEIN